MRKATCIFLALLVLRDIGWARETASQPSQSVTQDYVLALSAADAFLFAWRNRDQNLALSVVSPKMTRAHFKTLCDGLSW